MTSPEQPSSPELPPRPPVLAAPRRRPPLARGPSPLVPAFAAFGRDPLGFLRACKERHGEVFTIHCVAFRMTFLMSPELRRDFFAAKDDVLDLQPILGRVMRAITGTEHFHDERFTRFSTEHMRSAIWRPGAVEPFLASIQAEVEDAVERWIRRGEIDLFASASELATAITLRCFLGERTRAAHGERLASLYRDLENHARSFMAALLPNALSPSARRAARAQREILAILQGLVQEYRRDVAAGRADLHYLRPWIEHRFDDGSSFTTEEIMSHLLGLIFAAHTNTAGLLGWALGELLTRPRLLAEVVEEQDAFAARGADLRSLAGLRSLAVLDRCLKETARLHLTPILARKAARPFPAGPFEIPAGDLVCISPIVAHLDPVAFPDPERFDPDRFRDGASAKTHVLDASFVPFGMGTHRCLGEHFANAVHRLGCHLILRRAELSLVDAALPPPDWRDGGTAWPVRPIRARVTPRRRPAP